MTIPLPASANGKPPAPATPIEGQASGQFLPDVSSLSDEELNAHEESVRQVKARRLEERQAAAITMLKEQAGIALALGISRLRLKAVLEGKDDGAPLPSGARIDGRTVVAAKFANPRNAAESWSGRGNPPKWYADALASGLTEDDLRIKSEGP